MTVPSHIVRAFQRLGRLSTFVQFQSELLNRIQEETGNSEQFLKDFQKLETNVDRVNTLYDKLQLYELLEDKFTPDGKNDRKAKKHKEKADKLFASGQYDKALQYYTRAVMKAENWELLATIFANRSATLFKLDLYDESLADINRAFDNYPEHLQPSLLARKEKVMGLVGGSLPLCSFHEPTPEISSQNLSIPCASSSVEIKMDAKSRRHVFAAKTIEVGEVVAVETPFSFILAAADLYHCHLCYELCYNPIPCQSCSQSLYCSEDCRNESNDKYHRFECPILVSLKNIVGKHKACILAVKMSFLIDEPTRVQDIYLLEKNMGTENNEVFTTALITALIYHLVKTHTQKLTHCDQEAQNKFIDFLMVHLRICLNHASGIDELCPNFKQDTHELLHFKSETVACALFPFYSLFRHACCPNVFAHHHGTKRVLRAVRTIEKGKECFVSYGPYYVEHSKEDRRNRLLSQYHITCECRACVENWPQLDLKPYYLKSQEDLVFVNEIRDANVKAARRGLDRIIEKVKQLEVFEPLSDLTLQQKLMSYCFDIFGNKRMIA